MKKYRTVGLENEKNYSNFIDYMLLYSDMFSLVYFQYKTQELYTPSVSFLKKKLSKYKIQSKFTKSWPGTYTANEFNNIYELVYYRSDITANRFLKLTKSIYDWDYPDFPMDLCFYKDNHAVFALSAHERWNALYTDDADFVSGLKRIGINIIFEGEAEEMEIFSLTKTEANNASC